LEDIPGTVQIQLQEVILMTNYREILRLNCLGIYKQDIAQACGCSRNTVASVLKKAGDKGIGWETVQAIIVFSLDDGVLGDPSLRIRKFDGSNNEWTNFVINNCNMRSQDTSGPECNNIILITNTI
jgi:hypothetical protein